MKLKKKLKKFFVLFSVVSLLFCSYFSFSASALTPVYFKHAQPQVTTNSCYIEISYGYKHYFLYVFGYIRDSVNNTAQTDSQYTQTSFSCYSVSDTELAIKYSLVSDICSVYQMQGYWVSSDGDVWTVETEVNEPLTFTIGPSDTRANVRFYGIVDIPWSNSNWGSSDYVFVYGSDSVLNEKLDSIKSAIKDGNQEQTDAITSNQDKNSSEIQKNDDENTDKVISNQDKNHDDLKNGWEQEDDIDTSVTDDYGDKDKELQNATTNGRNQTVSVFNSFGSLFQSDGHLYKGLLSVSAIFTQFMQIDWISSILNFSLALGVFAFVIGTGSVVFRSAHENYKNKHTSKSENNSEGG